MHRSMGILVIALVSAATGIYLPNLTPNSYTHGYSLGVQVNTMTSVQNIMPFEWYSLPWCAPAKEIRKEFEHKSQNLGEVLWGEKPEISLYHVSMLEDQKCTLLCDPVEYSEKDLRQFQNRIEQRYRGHMSLDHLPVAEDATVGKQVNLGFPLGIPAGAVGSETFLYNHLAFTVQYHKVPQVLASDGAPLEESQKQDLYRIVGFTVTPHSVDHEELACNNQFDLAARPDTKMQAMNVPKVTWSYSVSWKENEDITWSTRWDAYLSSTPLESRIHWFAIINSSLVVIFLTVIIAIILLRALHRDFTRYEQFRSDNVGRMDPEDQQEETGWKLVHTEVFRKPKHPLLLSIYVGTGSQLLGMSLSTLLFALFGFLSPANRGALLSSLIFLFVVLGSHAGFVSACMLKMFGMRKWSHIFAVGLFFPGQIVAVWFCLNLLLWKEESASAVPFTAVLTIFALWLGVNLMLVLIGAVVGFKRKTIENPCKVNQVNRTIPPQPWFLQSPQCWLLPGVVPFGAAFIESVFILASVWQGKIYYVFGFLSLVFLILVVTCAETTIVMVYFQLTREDYNWWWRSFLTPGSYAIWFYLYCISYYYTSLQITSFLSSILYFGYMAMVAYFFFVLTGTVGFLSSFMFVRKIYSSIKLD
eukprot:TRINITY_DN24741_c0_g1_i1.p1 TRINITY_DN24741_c0_g1~~TRINITY_DN24741_c0_g1_i1.p1  ORF type:complete len:643 (+),score=235.85 TRINITY_DN24741_c0_g1_i1:68-1996(+)